MLDDPVYTQSTGGFFVPSPEDWDPGPYCLRVTFDPYGKVGEFGTADGIRLVACPDDIADQVNALLRDLRPPH